MTIHTLNFSTSLSMYEITDRIDELRQERDDLADDLDNADEGHDAEAAQAALESWKEEADELEALESIADELKGMGGDHQWGSDWYPGELIHENDFESRMDDLVDDCYPELSKDLPSWVSLTIDYDALKQDYTSHEFDGNTFYVR